MEWAGIIVVLLAATAVVLLAVGDTLRNGFISSLCQLDPTNSFCKVLSDPLFVKVGLTAWLVTIAVWDARTARIPNWLTFPVMLAAGAWRLYQGVWIVLGIWVLLFMIWKVNIVGGGDAKLLMGVFALFPTFEFAFLFSVVVLVVSLPLLYAKHWWRRPAEMAQGVAQRITSGRIFPTYEELHTQGQQYAWTFCLPGLIYLWWFW